MSQFVEVVALPDSDWSLDVDTIPERLLEREQWVCWRTEQRDGKQTKIPVTPGSGSFASATDADTWAGFEAAREYAAAGRAAGVGFVFTDADPFVGVDLDDCRDPESGDVDETAMDIIERLDSYTEVSPSGTGFHVLVAGELPEGRNRRGSVELYDSARYFTVTGDHVEQTPRRVACRQDALKAIHRDYVAEAETDAHAPNETVDEPNEDGGAAVASSSESGGPGSDFDDEAVLEKAKNAANGSKFERLWKGNTAGYESHSEADMALCCLLAFWTGGDAMQMDRLFRQSGLYRGKWNEVHYGDGSTYGEKTVERAIETTTEFYEPPADDAAQKTIESARNSTGESGRTVSGERGALLREKNRLLSEQVDELETTVAEQQQQIADLEAERRRLQAALADCTADLEAATHSDSAPSWSSRVTQLLSGRDET
ncbi:hypothetical protein [Natronomonas salina]|uniref:phage NrS-1 polymerase family protein n=1 Tax=Natronomonas salina TaxID=1710540 RepID=UPI003CCDB6BA